MTDAIPFGTREWCEALVAAVNGSSEYRNAAAKWGVGFNGNLLFAFEAGGGLAAPLHLLLKLKEGRCDSAAFVPGSSHPEAGFTLRAPFPVWREILERRTLAAAAILTGRLKVEGDSIALLRHAGANRALIHCTASVPTAFPS
ncbi:MAG TPA: SCP2 sterol-binding domain-containing protein [Candidatus Eisenbacteria bacterium]|nr:SCP2 sterol-binding domain-containing protein [Candidatus Eisenbacteria bacterium]